MPSLLQRNIVTYTPYTKPAPIGEVFGKLTILEEAEKRSRVRYVRCQCACGNTVERKLTTLLRADGTRSCGCLKSDVKIGRPSIAKLSFAAIGCWNTYKGK